MLTLRVIRPVLYITILVLSVVAAYAFELRTEGIFTCTAERYRLDRYLGYCNAPAYGDYDHGAFWFGLEPGVQQFAADADVLFLGSSRMQFAFSTIAADEWFASQAASHYLMGFSHTENATFTAPLLARLKPRARVYIINVDRFFSDGETGPGSEILHDNDIRRRYSEKRLWQRLHRRICTSLAVICGSEFAFFRASKTGHWVVRGAGKVDAALVADGPSSNQDQWDRYTALAEQFVSELPVDRACVLLTIVPHTETKRAEAKAIASGVDLDLITPRPDGLRTFDGSHLDQPSAERWSQAFFDIAGPRIRRCLGAGEAHAVSAR